MLGFFGPRYARSDAVTICGNRVCKKVPPELTATHVEMTRRAGELGRRSGLFGVPTVLGCDAGAGRIEFERLEGLITFGRMIDRTGDSLDLARRAGRALAHIHECLDVPPHLRKPAKFVVQDGEGLVGIHGDFNTVNVCYQPDSDRLVVLDWACAEPFGRGSTVGTRHLDVCLMLRSLVVHQADLLRAVRRFRLRAHAFLEGYQDQWHKRLDPDILGSALLRTSLLCLRHSKGSDVFWKKCVYRLLGLTGHLTFRRAVGRWRREHAVGGRQSSRAPVGRLSTP